MRNPAAHVPMRRANRLASAAAIREVYESGRRATAPSAGCVAMIAGSGPPRVAVVAGRKLGGAVARNRAKRRLRAVVDPLIERMPAGTQAIVGATSRTNESEFASLASDVEAVLAKVGVLSNA